MRTLTRTALLPVGLAVAASVLSAAVGVRDALSVEPADALGGLATAATARHAQITGNTRIERRQRRTLERVTSVLEQAPLTLWTELRLGGLAARLLEGRFPGDAAFEPLANTAFSNLRFAAITERARVGLFTDSLDTPRQERRLTRTLRVFDRALVVADGAARRSASFLRLARGCRVLERTVTALGLEPEDPPPDPEPLPGFSLADVNPTSATYQQQVSPADFRTFTSAWYFGTAT